MKRSASAATVLAVLTAMGQGCGDGESLTAEQQQAFRQVVAYRTDPEDVLLRSFDYQQAAAEQYARNLRVLEGADLGEDDALSTLKGCTLEITDGSEPGKDPKVCDAALEAVRSAVDQRRD
jgi:hypothetical protein